MLRKNDTTDNHNHHRADCIWFIALVSVASRTASGTNRHYTELLVTNRIGRLYNSTTAVGETDARLGFDPVETQSLTDMIRNEELSSGITPLRHSGSNSALCPDYTDSESDTDEHFRYEFRNYDPPPSARQPRLRMADRGRSKDSRMAAIADEFVFTAPESVTMSTGVPSGAPSDWIVRPGTAVPSGMSLEAARALREGRATAAEVSKRMEQYRRANAEASKANNAANTQPPWMAKADDQRRKQEVARKRGRNSAGVEGPLDTGSSYGDDAQDPLADPPPDEEDDDFADAHSPRRSPTTSSMPPPRVPAPRKGGRRAKDESLFEQRLTSANVEHLTTRAKRPAKNAALMRILSTSTGTPQQPSTPVYAPAPQSAVAPTLAIEDALSHRPHHTREPSVKFIRSLVCFAGATTHAEAKRIGLIVGAKRGMAERCAEMCRVTQQPEGGSSTTELLFALDPSALLGPVDKLKHTGVCVDAYTGTSWRIPSDSVERFRALINSV